MQPEEEQPTEAGGHPDGDAGPTRGLPARIGWITRRVLVRAGIGVLVLVSLLWVAASMGAGMRFIIPYALGRAVPEGWSVEVGAVSGSWLDRIDIAGLSLTGPALDLDVEQVVLRHRLRPLLSRTVQIRDLSLTRPTARIDRSVPGAEPEAGSSDLLGRLLSGQPVGAWSVLAERMGVVDGHVDVELGGGHRYSLAGLEVRAAASLDDGGLDVSVDTLASAFVSVLPTADSTFGSAGRLAFGGRLSSGELRLDTLLLLSEHSNVGGAGRVAFSADKELLANVDFVVRAAPLDLRDVPLRLPEALKRDPVVEFAATGSGIPDSMRVEFDGTALGGTSRVTGQGIVRPSVSEDGDAPEAFRGSIRWEGIDLSLWASAPLDGTAAGEADVRLASFAPGSAFEVEGFARHEPSVSDGSRLVARPLSLDLEVTGRLAADSTNAEPSRPFRADGRATLRDAAGRMAARISADVTGPSVRWELDLRLDSATATGAGTARWGDVPGARVDRLAFRHFDARAIDTIFPSTDVTGRANGAMSGRSLDALRGSIGLALAASSLGNLAIDTLALASDIRGRRASGFLSARGALGDVETRYAAEVEDGAVTLEASELHYLRTDSLTEAPVLDLFGHGRGRWSLGAEREARLEAFVDSVRSGSATLSGAEVLVELDQERLTGLVEGSLAGVLPTPTRVSVDVDMTVGDVSEAQGRARLSARRPHANDETRVDSARVDVVADSGRFELEGWARPAAGGAVTVAGGGTLLDDSLTFDLDLGGAFPEPVAVLQGGRVDSVKAWVSGSRVGDRWRAARAQVTAEGVRWRELVASRSVAALRLDSAGLTLDSLAIDSNLLTARGEGVLPQAGSSGRIDVTADIIDLEPLRSMMGFEVLAAGESTFEASATGTVDSIAWSANASLEAMVVDELRLTGVQLDASGISVAPREVAFGLQSSEARMTLDRVILPASELRRVEVLAGGGPDSVRVVAETTVDDRRNASALVHIDPRPDRKVVRIEDLRFQIDRDEWRLAREALLSYASGVMVEPVLLRAGEQEIRVEGGVSSDGILDLNARMDSTDVGTVADLAGMPRLRGWLSGRVRLQGPAAAPEAWIDMNGAFHRVGRPPGPVELRVRANGRRVRGDLRLRDSRSGTLTLSGGGLLPADGQRPATSPTSPWPDGTIVGFASDSIDVAVAGDRFDLRWLEAFFTPESLASLGGTLEGSLTLQGSTDEPDLAGRLAVRGGSAHPTPLGVRWDSLTVVVRGDGPRLTVDSATVVGGAGRLTVNGTLGVEGSMPLDLTTSLRTFQAIRTDAYWAVVSGTVNVGGVARAPVVDGDVRVESLDVFLDERVTSQGLEPVELTDEDLRMLRERFGVVPELGPPQRDFSERITANLRVFFGRDSWLRKRTSPEMAVPFTGTIDVELRPGRAPSLQGSVEVVERRGFVEQFGRRFDLTEGTVTFEGPPEETSVDLRATYTIPSRDNPDDAEVTIVLEVTGTQDDLGLTLSSEPALENADIVSYIATGRPASGSLSFEGGSAEGGIVAAGADYALSQMTSVIEEAAARSVGLDVIEIRREGIRQATLVAGKYLSPRLYVGFAQPISLQEGDGLSYGSQGRSELEIEYEALRWLIVNVEGSGSSLRFFLRARRAY